MPRNIAVPCPKEKIMQIHAALAFLTLFTLGHGMPDLPDDGALQPTTFGLTGRIVNGTEALPGQFPHQVSLTRSWSLRHFCGGSIISSKLVLTAAHCLSLNGERVQPWTILVVGGILKLDENTSRRQERGVEEYRVHPMFNPSTLHNDVAVLQLSKPFTFTPEVHNIPLSGNPPVANTICQVSGWGYPEQGIPIETNDLMYVDLPIRPVDECRQLLKNITDLPAGMFCAGYISGGRDACQGDSGGGMVCNGVLTGIVSGGEGCAVPRLPGVYADIYYYLNWITNDEAIVVQRNNDSPNYSRNNNSEHLKSAITVVASSLVLLAIISRP